MIPNSKYFLVGDDLYQVTKKGNKLRLPTHKKDGTNGYQLFIDGKTNWYSLDQLKQMEGEG